MHLGLQARGARNFIPIGAIIDNASHCPVLKDEIIQVFGSGGRGYLCDCTFGDGGHTFALAESFPHIKVIGFDQDQEAISHGKVKIEERGLTQRVQLVYDNFSQLGCKVAELGLSGQISGVLFDLGVSTRHLMDPIRGFSFQQDGPLDMRMDQHHPTLPPVWEILEQKNENEISDMIYHYGEERYARRIAYAIKQFQQKQELRTTKQLENIVFHCYPRERRHRRIHPATKTFQALRIYLNRELEVLEQALHEALQILQEGGQMAVISFHSLEDRIVKHRFRDFAGLSKGTVLTAKPILPTAGECEENRRSRSAKLRVFRKGGLC